MGAERGCVRAPQPPAAPPADGPSPLPRTHHLRRHLVAVGVQRRHQVDARVLHQAAHAGVPVAVLAAQVLHEQQQQLAAQHLVAVEAGGIAELGLPCKGRASAPSPAPEAQDSERRCHPASLPGVPGAGGGWRTGAPRHRLSCRATALSPVPGWGAVFSPSSWSPGLSEISMA